MRTPAFAASAVTNNSSSVICPYRIIAGVDFADPQRDLHVGEGERPVRRRHERLTLDDEQQVQHRLVEHVPWPHLLLDHVESCLLEIQSGSHPRFPLRFVSSNGAKVYQREPRALLRLAPRFVQSVACRAGVPARSDDTKVSTVVAM